VSVKPVTIHYLLKLKLRNQLTQNTITLIEIVKTIKINTTISVERLLGQNVIRELNKS